MRAATSKNVQRLPSIFQHDDPVALTTAFRTVWIRGRYGGGKTSFAVWLTLELLKRRYARHVVSNIELTHPSLEFVRATNEKKFLRELVELYESAASVEDVSSITSELVDCVILIDESWRLLAEDMPAATRKTLTAYLRKLNQYLVMPSVMSVHKSLTVFCIERVWDGRAALGIPLWWYALITRTHDSIVLTSFFFTHFRVFKYYRSHALVSDKLYIYRYTPPADQQQQPLRRERSTLNVAAFVFNLSFAIVLVSVLIVLFNVVNAPVPVQTQTLQQPHTIFLPLVAR
jgi:NTP pyrophosphatase (non-canonical NTP hydrolase)